MTETLYQILYQSTSTHRDVTSADLQILREAISFNARHGIGGFLKRDQGHYYQVLEGSAEAVQPLVDRIRRDWRHFGFRVLLERSIQYRDFPGWDMGYVHDSDRSLTSLLGKTADQIDGHDSLRIIAHLKELSSKQLERFGPLTATA